MDSPEKEILFLTTFNEQIYNASGKNLIKSYKQHKPEGRLYCCYEDMPPLIDSDVYFWALHSSERLKDTLAKHKEFIPKSLGGISDICNCKNPLSIHDRDHKTGCHHTWWNRNWSRWFRKIVCLEYFGLYHIVSDYIIWVDSDCQFISKLSAQYIKAIFQNHSVFYMKGSSRFVDETGIFGIKLDQDGMLFIKKLVECYVSGKFTSYVRWDDGYIFMKLRQKYNIPAIDIVEKDCKVTRVAEHSKLKRFIVHNKGLHGRKLGIMK